MSFNSPIFLLFLFLFLPIYAFLARSSTARTMLLLISGILFYAAGQGANLTLFLFCVTVNFILCNQIKASTKYRRSLLALTITMQVVILIYYRILQNFSDSGLFPLGLSFFTFTGIAYAVDVYNETTAPLDPVHYLAALSFFPVVVSGPLMRAQELARQMQSRFADFSAERGAVALMLVSNGLMKKGVSEALQMIGPGHRYFAVHAIGEAQWISVLCFAGRYYADFSGYTDIARGIGHLMGFEIPENFHLPYFSRSINEFWRRWHMTLSHWVREYIYQPLTFSEAFGFLKFIPGVGPAAFRQRNYLSLIVSMCVIGVWHGFTLNYLLWGVYMGLLLCLNLEERWKGKGPIATALKISLTFFFVVNGYVIFMQSTLAKSMGMFADMYRVSHLSLQLAAWPYFAWISIFLVGPHVVDFFLIKSRYLANHVGLAISLSCLFLVLHIVLLGYSGVSFVYFNF
jgi:alginate O-acetyltransferase complex protein AlgI